MDDKQNQKSKISALLRLRAQEASIPITQFSQDLKSSSPPAGFQKDNSFSSSDSSSSSSSQSSPQISPKNPNTFTLQPPNKSSANNSARSSDNISVASNHISQPSSANQAKPKSPLGADIINPRNVLNTPNFLKEYHYRRKSGGNNNNNITTLVKEGPNNEVKEIHQMTQFANIAGSTFRSVKSSARSSSSQDTAVNKNQPELKAEKMDSQGGVTSFAMSDISGDDEVEDKTLERKHLRNILKRSLRVAYFIGILFSMKNRVKIYGALRPIDQVKEFDSGQNVTKRKSLLPILPTDTFVVVWTIFMTILLVMTAILTPYAVSFVEDGDETFDIIDWIFNVAFGIDIIVTFLSAYHDPSVGLVTNFKAIAINYVKLWFWIDILAILPFDDIISAISENQGSAGRMNKLLRLLRFPRLYRLLKVLRLFKMLKLFTAVQAVNKIVKKLNLNIGMIRILKVMVNILFLNHCVGCIWFFIARVEDFDPDTWVVRCGLIDKNSWNQYVASYYWSFQTLTTVGYGDIPPKTLLERIFANIWMVIGVGFYSFTIGNLSNILANIDRKGAILKTKITAFNNFAIKVKLPEFLRQKIQRFFELNHKENVYYWMDPQESLKELPANLKTSLLLYSYYGMIKNIRLLQLDANFTASILTHLKLLKLKKGETLYRQDDPAEEVFFISKGSVKLVNEFGQSIYAFTEGTYFGEIETIEDDKRISFCQATENTILLLCGRDHFLEALQDFPTIEMQIKRTIQSRRYKFSEKMKQLQERMETEDDNEKSGKKKMMNSTEYFNKVVVKSFTKDKPAAVKRKTVPPRMPSRVETDISRNGSSTFQALLRGNSTVFTKREVSHSQEDTNLTVKTSPFKAIRKALDTVNEEKGSPLKKTASEERPTPQLGAVKRPLMKMNLEALQGLKSPKEEERRLLDEPSSKMEQVSLFQNNPQQGDNDDLLELDTTPPMAKIRQQKREDAPMTFGPFGGSGLINSQTSLIKNDKNEESLITDPSQSKSDLGSSPNHDAMSLSISSSQSGGGGFRKLISLTSQNNNWVIPENNGETQNQNMNMNQRKFAGVSPLHLLRVPGIPDGESVIQEEDSEIEASATISRANSGIGFEDFDLPKSTKKIVNMNSSELSKSKQFGNLVKILSDLRQKSDPNNQASKRSQGSRVFNLEGEDDSNIRPSIADDEFD